MEDLTNSVAPMSWRDRLDQLPVNGSIAVESKLAKSVRCIVSKHFHKKDLKINKRFTVKKDPNSPKGNFRAWRLDDKVNK